MKPTTTPPTAQPKHTAELHLAFEPSRRDYYGEVVCGDIVSSADKQIVIASSVTPSMAATILAAVNSHQELVEALKACQALFKAFDNRSDWPELQDALTKTNALLSKLAGGGK